MATPRTRQNLAAAGAGVASALLGAGVGELVAALVAPASSPFAVFGGGLIDIAPPWAKDLAIALFGLADKVALLTGIAIVLAAVSAFAGVLELRRPPWGSLVTFGLGVVGAIIAVTRADAGGLAWVPAIVAGGTAALAMRLLVRLLRPAAPADPRPARTNGMPRPTTCPTADASSPGPARPPPSASSR
ncbi:hypothetical protein [Microbacterium hominis]|uniref:hypothetical protein n=1 Tax=Microbacterium hominis TaxID=162426 RepID=UPI0020B80E98|nr:hypothetical protein [Microbacterium hominis]